jgi:hypothetical protein
MPPMPSPVIIIADNDFSGDCDGPMQMAMLFGSIDQGWGTALCVSDAINEVSAFAFATQMLYYGKYASVTLGRWTGSVHVADGLDRSYGDSSGTSIATNYPTPPGLAGSGIGIADAVGNMRLALSLASASSVVMFTGGPLSNYATLLQSGINHNGDGLPSGYSLVSAAVKLLVVMGGDYPNSAGLAGGAEYNFSNDTNSANYVASNWPTPIVFCGYTLGATFNVGALIQVNRPPDDITAYCLTTQVGPGGTRSSWDACAFLYALTGENYNGTNNFSLFGPGVNSVNGATGANSFSGGSSGATIANYGNVGQGVHYYLLQGTATTAQVTTAIDLLIASATSPSQPTPLFFAKINETSGTSIADSGSNASTHGSGTITGSTPPTFGDHYLDFTASTLGSNGQVAWTDANTTDLGFDATHPFTAVASMALVGGTEGNYATIFQRNRDGTVTGGDSSGLPPFWTIYTGAFNGGKVGLTLSDGSNFSQPLGPLANTSTWLTVAAGQDIVNNNVFMNWNTATTLGGANASPLLNTVGTGGGHLTIGNDGTPNEFTCHQIGNLRIYNTVLTRGQHSQCHFEPIEATVPTAGTTIQVVMPLYLRPPFTTSRGGWWVFVNGVRAGLAASAPSASGQTITLTMANVIHSGQTVTLAYYNGATVDSSSQRLQNFASFGVTNNSTA